MLAELALSSWETIARRGWMMATGACPPGEYRRMTSEKGAAALRSTLSLASGRHRDAAAAWIAPWHRRAAANAKRLRKRQRPW